MLIEKDVWVVVLAIKPVLRRSNAGHCAVDVLVAREHDERRVCALHCTRYMFLIRDAWSVLIEGVAIIIVVLRGNCDDCRVRWRFWGGDNGVVGVQS